jgi:hypothetical protein
LHSSDEVIALKKLYLILPLSILIITSCSAVKRQYSKDIPLDESKELLEYYKNRSAWTRVVLEDLGEGGSVPRDTKVKIFDVDTHFSGSVSVETLKKDKRIVHGLEIERPLTEDKFHAAMDDVFWFKDPTMRQVDYIRKWAKKPAQAIMSHDVFVGMPAEAAEESWGVAAKKNVNEIGDKREEQWVYPVGKRSKYIYIIDGKVSKWED